MVFVTLLCFRLLRYVFYVCFDLCCVYGVGICVNVCGVVCVVCLFLASECCLS